MANKKGSKDDKLIQELYEKLDWFTFEATEEEFDPDQVNAIVNLLDTLDPLEESYIRQPAEDGNSEGEEQLVPVSNPQAAFERFKKKYHITEEDLLRKNGRAVSEKATGEKIVPFPTEFSEELTPNSADVHELTGQAAEEKDGLPVAAGQNVQSANGERTPDADTSAATSDKAGKKRRRRFLSSIWGKVAVALIIVVAMGAALTVGTSAVHQKSFFETIQSGVNSVRIIVTGNEMESESHVWESERKECVYYDSWEQIATINSNILVPNYIPEGMVLKQLYQRDNDSYILYKGQYENEETNELLFISVRYFEKEYASIELIDEEKWLQINRNDDTAISYYQRDEDYLAMWQERKCIYTVEAGNLDVIDEIVSSME